MIFYRKSLLENEFNMWLIDPEAPLWTKMYNLQETIHDNSAQTEGAEYLGTEFLRIVNWKSELHQKQHISTLNGSKAQ